MSHFHYIVGFCLVWSLYLFAMQPGWAGMHNSQHIQYIHPPSSTETLNILANFLAHHPNIPAYVTGDFNNYLDVTLDKFSVSPRGQGLLGLQMPFTRLLAEMGLRDVWRTHTQQSKVFSCHSCSHQGLSRIDHGLCNEEMFPMIPSSHYEPSASVL